VPDIASHRIRVGAFDCLVAKDGSTSPRPLSELMADPPDGLADHPITMLGGILVADTREGRVLIDSGDGPHRGPRTHAAELALAAEGISPESVDVVLLTHGDPDHILGLLTAEGKLVYGDARYILHRDLWTAWQSPPSAGLYFPDQGTFVKQLAECIAERHTLFDGESEAIAGIMAIPALGHRVGHTVYMIESEGQKLLHIGDAAVHPPFLEYPGKVNIRHDTNQEQARDSRRMISARAASEGAMVVGTHFELPGVGTLTHAGEDRYTWTPIVAQERN